MSRSFRKPISRYKDRFRQQYSHRMQRCRQRTVIAGADENCDVLLPLSNASYRYLLIRPWQIHDYHFNYEHAGPGYEELRRRFSRK